MKMENKTVVFILVCIVLAIVGPFVTIWSLNTLFNTGIDYSLKTWFAVVFLSMVYNAKNLTK